MVLVPDASVLVAPPEIPIVTVELNTVVPSITTLQVFAALLLMVQDDDVETNCKDHDIVVVLLETF